MFGRHKTCLASLLDPFLDIVFLKLVDNKTYLFSMIQTVLENKIIHIQIYCFISFTSTLKTQIKTQMFLSTTFVYLHKHKT